MGCPNKECEHYNKNSDKCYNCGSCEGTPVLQEGVEYHLEYVDSETIRLSCVK